MMEYSPMMVVMLWALTPSDASSVAAHVQEVPTPPMTVHQESYFTFNHGKPFVAEQDPLTGAILNLKTTQVLADDYVYEEEEEDETDGIDRKDGPKVYTRNDIIQPSKDPDLHKFLNLPVHYSTSGKFPLISSSYANTKVQGHSANAQSNHRLSPTSSTSTVSPSYYPLKTSATTPSTTTTTTSTTTTTTTTTPKPTTTTTRPTTTRTTTTTKPPPSYEYEYEYDYDREPENDKKTTTQKIFDFFEKDYAFLGASEEEKNTTKVEYVMPSSPEKPHKEEETMISPNSNLFIPGDYLKPNLIEKGNENTTNSSLNDSKVTIIQETSTELNKPINETSLANSTTYSTINTTYNYSKNPTLNKDSENEKENDKTEESIQFVTTTKLEIETTTPKIEASSVKIPMKDKIVPFFPTIPSDLRENIFGTSSKPAETSTKSTQNDMENKQSDLPSTHVIKPVPFHPTSTYQVHESRPQDSLSQATRPTENINPYNPYQRPYMANSDVPPEMLPPVRPAETTYNHQRPQERPLSDSYTYRPIESFHPTQNRPLNNRPIETIGNKQPSSAHDHHILRPHSEIRPNEQPTASSSQTQRPTDTRPNENIHRPDFKVSNRPIMSTLPSNRPTDSSLSQHNKPYEVVPPYRPHILQGNPTDSGLSNRPQEMPQKQMPQRPVGRPDDRYPTYNPIRPQEIKPEQRPQHIPEYRPLGARPEEQRPQNIKPELRPQHIPQYRPQASRPEESRPQEMKPESKPQHISEYRPLGSRPEEVRPSGIQEYSVGLGTRVPDVNNKRQENPTFNNNKYQVQFTQPSKVENHFIKVSPGQENPSYSLQTSFSIGVPPPDEVEGQSSVISTNVGSSGNKGVGQVLFPDEAEKRPWAHQEEKRPIPPVSEPEKYPRPPWESHLKPPLVFNHLKKEPFLHKRPKPARPDLPNILPQFRPNAKIGHAEPHVYLKTPLDTLQPPPLPRPQFLRAEPPIPEEEMPVHRRNGQTTRVVPIQPIIPNPPKRGSLRSEDEKTDPVFVVYPSNNAQDGVVVGTRGPQRPLPPDNLDIEDSFPLDNNKNFQARVDTPILKVKPTKPVIKNEFPYPLIKPTEVEEKVSTTVTKEYTAFSPTVPPTEKEHDTEINIIPYLQDYMPFATKKPSQDPPKWNVGEDIKPISVTLKTQKIEQTTTKIDNHKSEESPTPQDFQAPFHASLSAPNQGWSVVRPRPEPEKEEEPTTIKAQEEQEGKFDIQNFKPQLFGGFKPIIPPIEDKETIKHEKENV